MNYQMFLDGFMILMFLWLPVGHITAAEWLRRKNNATNRFQQEHFWHDTMSSFKGWWYGATAVTFIYWAVRFFA